MLTTTALVFAVTLLTSFLRKVVFPRWGRVGVQVIAFVLALVGALYATYQGQFPVIVTWVKEALTIFASAVALYEVILKQIPVFRKSSV